MKTFVLHNNYAAAHNKTTAGALCNSESPVLSVLPDTAVLKDGRPFFIPDFAEPCSMQAHLVVRISRLGRSISSRFASRYYDAATVGVTFRADALLARLRAEGLPWDVAVGFDGAAVIGHFVPVDGLDVMNVPFQVMLDGTVAQEGRTDRMVCCINDSIAYISRFYTLRQGDLLFTGAPAEAVGVRIDQHVCGTLDGEALLNFNVK